MKRLKITSVLLSVVMCVTMAFPSMCVMADETAEPTETQTEATEKKQEPKATEKKQPTKAPEKKQDPTEPNEEAPTEPEKKQESTEPKKETPTEPEKKQEPTEPKKEDPTESEKQEPTESKKEEPAESEKQEPTESKNEEPTYPEKQEPTESKKVEPTEPKKEDPTEPEKQEPTESKEEKPTEPEKQDPTETETQAPTETETQVPEETEPEKEPEVTEVPGGKVTKAPKNAAISNVKVSDTGILTWDAVDGADLYLVFVYENAEAFSQNRNYYDSLDEFYYDSWSNESCWSVDKNEDRTVDLYKFIRNYIKSEEISKTDDNNYYIYLIALSSEWKEKSAAWNTKLHYETNVEPVEISNFKIGISDGKLTWNKITDAVKYTVEIETVNYDGISIDTTALSCNIKAAIDNAIIDRKLWKQNSYFIRLTAYDSDDVVLAGWNTGWGRSYTDTFIYKSKVEPKALPSIQNAHIDSDILSWNSYSGADKYFIRVIADNYDNAFSGFYSSSQVNIRNVIRELVDNDCVKEYSHYTVELYAFNFTKYYNGVMNGYRDLNTDADGPEHTPPEFVLAQWTGSFNYKIENTLSVSGKTAKVKKKKVRKKKQTLNVGKVIKFNNKGQGRITYSKISGSKKISINGSNGKVTVKKKTKKGTYKVTVWVKAAGDATHLSTKKKVTFKIKVK